MKRGTIESPKTKRLVALLGVELWGAVGILESLWHFCARHALRGDVGRWSNEEIAAAISWGGEPDKLVNALVDARWLDKSSQYRLLVHDWHDHCDESVKKTLSNRRENFATSDEVSGNGEKVRPQPKPEPEPLPEPSLSQAFKVDLKLDARDLEKIWQEVRVDANRVGKVVLPKTVRNRHTILGLCYLARTMFSENWLFEAVEGVAKAKTPIKDRCGYLYSIVVKKTPELKELLAAVRIPQELAQ